MKSARRFRASTHLAASIASEDPFTARAVEEIKEEINTDDSRRDTIDDLQKDDYIPPNRRMMLKCEQKDKWIEAEEDKLRSFALNHVMDKKPSIPGNAKALPLKWIYTVKKDLKGTIVRYKARLHRHIQSSS